ncbi:hypothetical protein ACF08W_34665 [Streptomyces sp. NPDC015144]|uniref:hypothetical protein n=1 Tax=Streptomyces sp. NPDC015144 TaxID=3364944 RepID=UPI0036F8816F
MLSISSAAIAVAAASGPSTPVGTTGGIGGGTALLLSVTAWAIVKWRRTSSPESRTLAQSLGAIVKATKSTITAAKGVGGAVRAVARFVAGRELDGRPTSTATLWQPGVRTRPKRRPTDQEAAMAAVAAAPPKVSLVKKRRRGARPWARHTAGWVKGYQGRGARALDRAVRVALATARVTGRAARGTQHAYRVLGAWGCWPYAARGLARIAGVSLVVAQIVPAWTTEGWAVAGAAAVPCVALARRTRPGRLSDDAVYGPRIWAVLQADLKLGEEEQREHWLKLSDDLRAPDARIAIRLPWTWRGTDHERQELANLIDSRVPGDWQGRHFLKNDEYSAIYTHKPPSPPPAPEPECPDRVDLSDPRIQEALAALGPEEFLLGVDAHGELVIRKMSGELSHWAFSVGSGGGKSTTLQWLAVQMVMKSGTIVGIDPKLISLKPLEGIPGVHLYKDPDNAIDMRRGLEWAADVTAARFFEIEQGTETEFPPLYIFLEESNELSGLLRAVWNRIRIKTGDEKEQAADPIWEDVVAYMLRFGRAANVHLIAVFQDFKDNQFGGTSLQPLFRLKILGNYDVRQWERITGLNKTVMPPNVEKAGRMAMVSEGRPITYQTPYLFVPTGEGDEKRPATETESIELYNQYYRDLRERFGYSDRGLYTEPPAVSPRGVPKLLRGRVEPLSRDTGTNGPIGAPEGGLMYETAGHGVTHQGGVTGDVTAPRDRLRLIPGQGAPEAAEDPLEAPRLLTIAEIAREMQACGYEIEASLIRQHKRRRETTGFPTGIEMDGTEKFTLGQLITFYEQRGLTKREESKEGADQGDAV